MSFLSTHFDDKIQMTITFLLRSSQVLFLLHFLVIIIHGLSSDYNKIFSSSFYDLLQRCQVRCSQVQESGWCTRTWAWILLPAITRYISSHLTHAPTLSPQHNTHALSIFVESVLSSSKHFLFFSTQKQISCPSALSTTTPPCLRAQITSFVCSIWA